MIPEVLDRGILILKCDWQEIDGHFTKVAIRVSLNKYYVLLCVVHLFDALTALQWMPFILRTSTTL